MFSLTTTAISEMSVVDDVGVEHQVYAGTALPNQGLNISQEQMDEMEITATKKSSATDILGTASFALFTLLPMLLTSMKEAFYVVGWLGAWGVPAIMAWVIQSSLWYLYGRDIFQIMTNRSLKSFE
jgi:hypothetical protein